MNLNQEGVEKAAEAFYRIVADCIGDMPPWEALPELRKQQFIEEQTTALTAYFDHLKEAGLMQEGRGWDHAASGYWGANSSDSKMLPHDFLCLIIKQPEEGK